MSLKAKYQFQKFLVLSLFFFALLLMFSLVLFKIIVLFFFVLQLHIWTKTDDYEDNNERLLLEA